MTEVSTPGDVRLWRSAALRLLIAYKVRSAWLGRQRADGIVSPLMLTSVPALCQSDRPLAMDRRCPLCRRRRARRACPARGDSICALCCGTKRLVEINCPPDCAYLVSAHSHPPAAVQRGRDRDLRFLVALLNGLTERQQRLVLLVQALIRRDRPEEPTMADADVEQAVRALAETYETASRGIIYEHTAGTPSAGRLAAEIKTLVEAQRTAGLEVGDADIALVMRRVEGATQSARSALPGDEAAFLQLLRRALKDPGDTPALLGTSEAAGDRPGATSAGSGLIVPGR